MAVAHQANVLGPVVSAHADRVEVVVLETLPLERNSDDFVFDAQMLSQILYAGFRVGEVTCPAKYFPEASSIGFARSLKYGAGCLAVAMQFRLSRWGLGRYRTFDWANPNADGRSR